MVRLKGLDLRCGEGRLGLQSAPALCRVPSGSSPMGKRESRLTAGLFLVRLKGLEPTHISVREPKSRMSTNSITGAKEKPCCRSSRVWSGQRGSNSLPPPWQGGALPDELCPRQCLLFYHKKRSCQVFSCTAAKGRQSRAYSETSSEILAQTGKMKYTHTICQKGEKKWNFKRF